MINQKDYVPVQLIIKIGDCLLAVDGLGHQVYSARYLEKNHLSGRAQDHFRHHESVSVMQLYAAIRILLINTSSSGTAFFKCVAYWIYWSNASATVTPVLPSIPLTVVWRRASATRCSPWRATTSGR